MDFWRNPRFFFRSKRAHLRLDLLDIVGFRVLLIPRITKNTGEVENGTEILKILQGKTPKIIRNLSYVIHWISLRTPKIQIFYGPKIQGKTPNVQKYLVFIAIHQKKKMPSLRLCHIVQVSHVRKICLGYSHHPGHRFRNPLPSWNAVSVVNLQFYKPTTPRLPPISKLIACIGSIHVSHS